MSLRENSSSEAEHRVPHLRFIRIANCMIHQVGKLSLRFRVIGCPIRDTEYDQSCNGRWQTIVPKEHKHFETFAVILVSLKEEPAGFFWPTHVGSKDVHGVQSLSPIAIVLFFHQSRTTSLVKRDDCHSECLLQFKNGRQWGGGVVEGEREVRHPAVLRARLGGSHFVSVFWKGSKNLQASGITLRKNLHRSGSTPPYRGDAQQSKHSTTMASPSTPAREVVPATPQPLPGSGGGRKRTLGGREDPVATILATHGEGHGPLPMDMDMAMGDEALDDYIRGANRAGGDGSTIVISSSDEEVEPAQPPSSTLAKGKQLTHVSFTQHMTAQFKKADGAVKTTMEKAVKKHYNNVWKKNSLAYMVIGLEKSPSTQAWHVQGYAQALVGKHMRVSAFKKLLEKEEWPSVWLVESKGTPEQNKTYCTKEGNGNPLAFILEFGEIRELDPGRRTKTDWDAIRNHAARGEFDQVPSHAMVMYTGNLLKINAMGTGKMLASLERLDNYFIFGAPGVGKSRGARELVRHLLGFPTIEAMLDANEPYEKHAQNKWVDGYQGQQVVLIDDLEKEATYMAHDLKRIADLYPTRMEAKGIMIMMRPKHVIVTSNYAIEDIWYNNPTCAEAIRRRFKVIEMKDYNQFIKWMNSDSFKLVNCGQRVLVSTVKVELMAGITETTTTTSSSSSGTTTSSSSASTFVPQYQDR